ncbi:MAG: winged helix-turn-helix transcriptional regulator [Chloroflexi bacterium]|nr:MAG: winged helix-turn-helix transcriptional regulator [Chloroflexota bacterium]
MRLRTIRFASAALAARRTLIPFASRAAATRFTRASSRAVPNRRVTERSRLACSWLIISGPPRGFPNTLAFTNTPTRMGLLQTQVLSGADVAGLLDRLVVKELPGGRGLAAWSSLLRAHATLLRQLETDLEKETGLALADFDVLAQLALAGGSLRMTELADRALISRSGMTRRVARLVDVGLVSRAGADSDGRGVVVGLTEAGVARLTETAPVHARGISRLFVSRLDDQELAVLESALAKVTLDCTFG